MGCDMRIAIVGSGPTGFFLAKALLAQAADDWRIDIIERVPFLYGLVRYGVAPDHEKIKSVTKGYAKTLADPRVELLAGISVQESSGEAADTTVPELLEHYDRVFLCVGSQDDRRLGIDGEDAPNSYAARRFVGWYNGHPDDEHLAPNLAVKSAAIVGAGNVAIDIFRILMSKPERLHPTDISEKCLEALAGSQLDTIDVLVRRGPWDVAFTNPEVKELLHFEDLQYTFNQKLPSLDDAPAYADRTKLKNMEVFLELQERKVENPRLTVNFHFQVSPKKLELNEEGLVTGMVLGHNDLTYQEERSSISDSGRTSPLATDLFIRSVGYRGRALLGVPFHDKWGVVHSDDEGRVVNEEKNHLPGLYVSGWFRRGPSGVIGTNKKDAVQVAKAAMADEREGSISSAESFSSWRGKLAEKAVNKQGWDQIDAEELRRGEAQGRSRRKFLNSQEAIDSLKLTTS